MKKKGVSDAELVQKLQKGDEEAFKILYERYVKLAYYIAYKLCENGADCDDIVQESFLQVKAKIENLRNPALFKFWLNQIVISKCKNMFRKNRYITYEDEHYETKHNLVEVRPDRLPEKTMNHKCDYEILDSFINELSQGQKEAVVLHYLQQFNIEETALILELPVGTVKSRLSYARASLKEKVESYEKKNGVKLDFHSFDTFLALSMASILAQVTKPQTSLLATMKMYVPKSSMVSTIASKVMLTTIIGVTVVGGATLIKQFVENRQDSVSSPMKQFSLDENDEKSTFSAITLKNKEIKTARVAYFTIKDWAHCEDEILHMEKEQLADVYKLYERLKEDDSLYYRQLEAEGWSTFLRQAMEAK